MRVEELELSTADAVRYVEDPWAWANFLEDNGLPPCKAVYAKLATAFAGATDAWFAERAAAPVAEPRTCRGMRHDIAELVDFVARAPHLPLRVRQVFEVCVRDGLSINECSQRLGIGRETVRTHLRRLRDLHRRHLT